MRATSGTRRAAESSSSGPVPAAHPTARRLTLLAIALATLACGSPEPRDLTTLIVVDSLYVEPATGEPFTGPVYRGFPDAPDDGRLQLEGGLVEGAWDGEFVVYHPNGRVRYMGSFAAGGRCGPWTENADSTRNESVYEDLVDEIESLGVYPPCPER